MIDIHLAQQEYNNEFENTMLALKKSNSASTNVITQKYKSFFPRVFADTKKTFCPKLVGYKDLPIYAEAYDDGTKPENPYCFDNSKGIHETIQPIVSSCRKELQSRFESSVAYTRETLHAICADLCKIKSQVKRHFRDENYKAYRQSVVALGTFTGFKFGSSKRSLLSRKIFWAAVGYLTTGALCFPKETDENVRNFSFYAANTGLNFFNWWFNKNVRLTPESCECILEPCECIGTQEDLCEQILKEKKDGNKSLTFINKLKPVIIRDPIKKDKTKEPDQQKKTEDREMNESFPLISSENKAPEECLTLKKKETAKVSEEERKIEEEKEIEKEEESKVETSEEKTEEPCLPFKYKETHNKAKVSLEDCLPYKYRENNNNTKTR